MEIRLENSLLHNSHVENAHSFNNNKEERVLDKAFFKISPEKPSYRPGKQAVLPFLLLKIVLDGPGAQSVPARTIV